jgi:hypothetical protein
MIAKRIKHKKLFVKLFELSIFSAKKIKNVIAKRIKPKK